MVVLVDMGYYTFYRYHACKKWWSFKKEKEQKDPFLKETEFKEKLIEKYEFYLNKLMKDTKTDKMVIALDSLSEKNWKKDIFPEYKSNRPKNDDIHLLFKYLKQTFIPKLKKEYPNIEILIELGKEADDLVAEKIYELHQNKYEGDIIIIASDMDYLQLVEKDNKVVIKDMNLKVLSEKDFVGSEYLIWKIIHGDPSDNIPPIFKGRNSKKKKEELFQEILKIHKTKNFKNDSLPKDLFENEEDYNKFHFNKKLIQLKKYH
tara:strand:+ start:10080 stop:10862 length:783 start_codon:yes stop_codon:yes gene_type:complete